MSEIIGSSGRRRRQRTDAQRSAAAILDAAVAVLGSRPDAAVDEVANAAGVSRQTVYAHYPGRKALIAAVVNRVTEQAEAAMDAARLDEGPAAAAVVRVLEVSWRLFEDYPLLLQEASDALSPAELNEVHGPVFGRLERVVRRGQEAGEVDPQAPPRWLVAAIVGLGHAAGEEVGAGRMSVDEGVEALRRAVLRVLGADHPTAG